MFDKNEIIHCESYYEMCDYAYAGQDNLPSGIVAVDTQGLPEFIERVKNNGKKYIVVCSRSDFGLCLQQEHPPWRDLEKWCGMVVTPAIAYNDIKIQARVHPDNCNPTDKYSIKCWSFTSHTFNEIPENIVHLFMTNCFVQDKRVTAIPFGVNGTNGAKEAVNKLSTLNIDESKRTKLLYVNFQFYTVDRARLYQYYQSMDWPTVYRSDRNIDEYYEDLLTHKFVLCPEGNGSDCYRMLECLYAGAIPIMPMNDGLYLYYTNKQRAVFFKSLYGLDSTFLEKLYEKIIQEESGLDSDFLKVSAWRNLIESKRSLL